MALQNIHIAIGSLAYAIAQADGTIQPAEKETIRKLAQQELDNTDQADGGWITRMFEKLEQADIPLEEAYNYALDTLNANRYDYDFTEVEKRKCLHFLEKISEAFEGISDEEQAVLERFKQDMQQF
jgi:uncharacterized tellurite resistance protein B-like protein